MLVDVPKDVQQALIEYTAKQPEPPHKPPMQADVTDAVELIERAKRPIIYAGGGCIAADASAELLRFAERIKAPIATSVMGLSAIPTAHKYCAGLIGMHGHASVAQLIGQSDLVIAVGARFSDRVAGDRTKFCKHAKILHIDIDAAEIDKNVTTDAHICGDVKQTLELLNARVEQKADETMLQLNAELKREYPLPDCKGKLSPRTVIRYVSAHARDAIVATDVGQHQMWVAQEYSFPRAAHVFDKRRTGNNGLRTGRGDWRRDWHGQARRAVTGDGSFHMNMNELATATRLNLPITVFVFDNRTLGMVRQWQTLFYGGRYSSTNLDGNKTDFVKIAEAFGAKGYILDDDKDVAKIVDTALNENGVTVVDCKIDRDEFVLPMIPRARR